MRGTLQRRRDPYEWMRVGFATAGFSAAVIVPAMLALLGLAIWMFLEIRQAGMRPAIILVIYLVAALLYMNLGVWLHEQLHCLAFRGTVHAARTHVTYVRKFWLVLGGFYRVRGGLSYNVISRALLGPLYFTLGLLAIAFLGSLVLPGWWLPLLLSLAVFSLLDMLHDLYMYTRIRRIGSQGRYWDRGKELEVVWRE